ncbi:MAG TPA: protein translocase subunit SecF [Gemmatimonadaceae bacterium]|nr:protein translocase subunit SecF [Gemmatimonadaceae bacterium]
MLRILHDTKIDFIRLWKITTIVTLLFMLPGIIAIAISGYHYSVEFTGGTLMQVSFPKAPDVGDVRSTLDAAGIKGAEIQTFGKDSVLIIRAQDPRSVAQQTRGAESVAGDITGALTKKYGPPPAFRVDRTEAVGPKVGGELRQKAFYAVLLSFVITLIYLAWRFEWRFGLAAVIATAHDILGTLAFIKYLHLEISLIVVGGVLTMIGYSLNDTIIIFDRVREDLRKRRKESLYETLNRGVNETLPRSVLTHTTVFACLTALALLGGEVIRPFALVMMFGVVTGTFSSIYVAPVILLWIERKWPRALGEKGGVGPRSVRSTPSSTPPQQQRRKASGES